MGKKKIEVILTEKDKIKIKEIEDIDSRIKDLDKKYKRENGLKNKNLAEIKKIENEVAWLIRHRNNVQDSLYGSEKNDNENT